MWASTRTVSLQGAVGHVVDVQVDVSHGQIATNLVGRADASINEARDRCRSAIQNSEFDWPTSKRITILLSPADLPKRGSHFDLAIAVAVLAANGREFPRGALDDLVLIGELSLDGRLRCIPGVLPMVMAAAARGIRRIVVPEPQVGSSTRSPGSVVMRRHRAIAFGFVSTTYTLSDANPAVTVSDHALLIGNAGKSSIKRT